MMRANTRLVFAAGLAFAAVSVLSIEAGPAGPALAVGVRAEACNQDCVGRARRHRRERYCCKRVVVCWKHCTRHIPYIDGNVRAACEREVAACRQREHERRLREARDAQERERLRQEHLARQRRIADAARQASALARAASQGRSEAETKLAELRRIALQADMAAIQAAANGVKAAAARAKGASASANNVCR